MTPVRVVIDRSHLENGADQPEQGLDVPQACVYCERERLQAELSRLWSSQSRSGDQGVPRALRHSKVASARCAVADNRHALLRQRRPPTAGASLLSSESGRGERA